MRQGKMPVLIGLVSTASLCGVVRAESATTQEQIKAVEAVTPPTTVKEISARQKKIAEELKALQPSTIPATTQPLEATTQPSDYATNLWFKLKSAQELLEAQQKELEAVQALKSEESAKELKQRIEEYKKKTAELEEHLEAYEAGQRTPLSDMSVPELTKRLEELKAFYERLNQEQISEVEAQTARIKRLGEFKAEREAINEQIAEARKAHVKAVAEFKDRTTTAKATEEAKPVKIMRRLAELDLLMALVRAELLRLEEERLSLRQQREADRLKALQPYVKTLQDWMAAITKQISRDQQRYAEWQLEQARAKDKPKYEELYWEAYLKILKAAEKFKSYENPTRDRYPEGKLGRLENTIARYETYWENFIESVSRRSGEEVLKAYGTIRKQLEEARQRDVRLTAYLDQSIDEREAVALRRDQVVEEIDKYQELLSEAASGTTDEKATERQTALTKHRLELIQLVDDIAALQNSLLERLNKAEEINDEFIALLDTYRSQLYWSYLVVQDQGLLTLELSKIRSEWTGEELQTNMSALHAAWQQGVKQVRSASLLEWVVSGALLVFALVGGTAVVGRRLRAKADAYEDRLGERIRDEGIEAAGLSERLWLAWLRLLDDTGPLVCVLLAIALGLLVLDITDGVYRVVMGAVMFFGAILVSFGVVGALFAPTRPRYRIIRCSNKVAGYYRKWLYGLLYATLIGAPIPLFLTLVDAFPSTRTGLWQIYKSVGLLIVFLFLLRRQMVLKVVGRPEDLSARWLYSLVASVYPLLPLAALGLLVLEALGFGALTSYILRNLILTLVILLAGTTLTRYLADLSGKWRRDFEKEREARQEEQEGETAEAAEPVTESTWGGERTVVAAVEEEEATEAEFFLAVGSFLGAWVVRLGALVLILGVWGITLVEIHSALTYQLTGTGDQVITLWRVLAAVLVAIMGAVVSRFVRAILNKRVYPAYEALDLGARAAINTILNYLLIVLGIYIAMQLVYVDLGALTVLLGTLGLGIGLGLQPLFINFISGLMIFGERHIRPGDIVEVGDQVGEVIAVSMRGTRVRTFDNIDMIIPNSEFITTRVVNWSLQSRQIRGQINIGVAYGSDIELVRELLLKVANEHPKVLKEPEPIVWFMDFGDSALIFRLLVHFADLSDRYSSLTEMRFTIDKLFAEHGITIPFPQRTISLIDDKPLRVELTDGSDEDDEDDETAPDDQAGNPGDRPKRRGGSKRKRRGAGASDFPGMGMVGSGGDE